MGKFRMASGGYREYDDTTDKQKLYKKTLDLIDENTGNDTGFWVELWVILQDIFSKEQPSINQLKDDLKNNLISKIK